MQIAIELGDEVSAAAEATIRRMAELCVLHDVDFAGDEITVDRGDFTQIAAGDGHTDAATLFALVQSISSGEIRLPDGYIPLPSGKRVRV